MTCYLKTIMALVVALMAAAGVSHDANAGNGAAADAVAPAALRDGPVYTPPFV